MNKPAQPTSFGTTPAVTPEELEASRKAMLFVFHLMTARSIAELDAVISKYTALNAHYGPTVARIIEEQRTKLGRASRPS